ncbi:MAG: hypothetical protein O9340_09890 [Cyclobacteriaceae bacterium]|nr:hypothetical protein [Cyclobacteriaceae bacterium]
MLNFTFFSFKLHGATYYSVSNGNWTGSIWNSSTTTGTGSPLPTLVDGDEIIIDDQVTISSGTINISANIKIFIRTTSTSNPAKLIFVTGGKLVLSNSSSTIKLENTTGNASFNPQIDGSGSGSSNQITIGSNEVWRASNGDIQGIGTLTTNSNNGVLPVELLFFKIDE